MNKKPAPFLAAALTLALGWFGCSPSSNAPASGTAPVSPPAADELARGFAAPPDSVRPWVYWMWMDGNLSRDGITADLEAMKRAGIGGVIICEVNVGVPRGPVEFMGPEWRRLFVHVVREAERLGLEITLNAGPGWTGSGGPWVKPELSMQHIVASATRGERAAALRRRPAAAGAPPGLLRRRIAAAGPREGQERLLPRCLGAGLSDPARGRRHPRHR